jgi:hypothetical protein
MAMTNEQKNKVAAEIMMEGVPEGISRAAAEVIALYKAFEKRSDIDRGSEAVLTLATLYAFQLSITLPQTSGH